MRFSPTYKSIDDRTPITADHLNKLNEDVTAAFGSLNGSAFVSPLVLSGTGQHLSGASGTASNSIYGFSRWFGYGTANQCIRDVTGYGAVGDGTTDDTAAIQSAIDDCPVTGGMVLFPPGTYIVSGTIYMAGTDGSRSGIRLQGVGSSSVIKLKASCPVNMSAIVCGSLSAQIEDVEIDGFQFDGNSANQTSGSTQSIVAMYGTTRCSVTNCFFSNILGVAISAGGSSEGRISCCRISDCSIDGIVTTPSWSVNASPAANLRISDCIIENCTANGIRVSSCNHVLVNGCSFKDNVARGIYITNWGKSGAQGVVVSGCMFFGNSSGIDVLSDSSNVSVDRLVFRGNSIFCNGASASHGIGLATDGGTIRMFSITGNAIIKPGIGIYVAGDIKKGTISFNSAAGCTFDGISVAGGGGVDEVDCAEYIEVCGNSCGDNADYGIRIASTVKNCGIHMNTLTNNTDGNLIDSGSDNDVSHNAGF